MVASPPAPGVAVAPALTVPPPVLTPVVPRVGSVVEPVADVTVEDGVAGGVVLEA
jgi:hypothetical protein